MTLSRSTPLKRKAPKRKTSPLKAADDLFSKLVRERDSSCLRCGSTDWLQCAHIWSRRYRATRWKMENAITLDRGCHKYFTEHPAEWAEWCEARRFCEAGICFGPDHEHHELSESHPFAAFSYETLRWRALNNEPERAVDALARLRALSEEIDR